MPVGLACYRDGVATPFFDTTSGFILGSASISFGGSGGSGGTSDANLVNGNPFYFLHTNNVSHELTVTISGTNISWSATESWVGTIFWGIG